MKRSHYLLTIFLCLTVAFSMTAQDKYFKEALKSGRPENGFYYAVIKGNKKVTLRDLQIKCEAYKYILIDYSNKTVEHFGATQESVGTFHFIPQDEVVAYIFSCLKFNSSHKFENMTHEGMAILPLDFPISNMKKMMVYWSGNVVGKMIDGYGYGFGYINLESNQVICFQGNMKNGIPQGEIKLKIVKITDLKKVYGDIHTLNVYQLSDGLHRFQCNNEYGYFNAIQQFGSMMISSERFKNASDFENGTAIVTVPRSKFHGQTSYRGYSLNDIGGSIDSDLEYVINKNGTFIDYSQSQKQKFDNKIASIEEQKEKERLARLERERQEKLERERQERERIAAEKQRLAEEKQRQRQQAAEEKRRRAEEAKKTYHKTPKRETCIGCWGKGYYTTQVFSDEAGGFWYNKTSICILCDGKGYTETHYY